MKLSPGVNGESTLLVHGLYQMSPLNHKRSTSSLAPPIFYVAKKWQLKGRFTNILLPKSYKAEL